jgi:hypothetical protein
MSDHAHAASSRPRRTTLTADLSVAKFNFFICSAASTKSSVLPVALRLVKGVLPPLTEADGVPLADFFAAFSASRFCFDADGGIVVDVYIR